MKVIISNGHFKMFLGTAAAEMEKKGVLAGFITAGYPTPWVKKIITLLQLEKKQSIDRLLKRKETISDSLVYPLWLSEALSRFMLFSRKEEVRNKYHELAISMYARQAVSIVKKLPAEIYHYRSGYGHQSAIEAKNKGMINICDHSIPNPEVMEYMVEHFGQYPSPEEKNQLHLSQFMQGILEDLRLADYIIVNSDFVKETFTSQGWSADNIYVLYNGMDEPFMRNLPDPKSIKKVNKTLKLMFAGTLEKRKGIDILFQALQRIKDIDWELNLIGSGLTQDIKENYSDFLKDNRVKVQSFMPRDQLGYEMTEADIFVFPSLAEGSARTVFMALASGCYVITTPNTGSIVEDGIHGSLIPPGDIGSLEESLRYAAENRGLVNKTGYSNAKLIKGHYQQEVQYADGLYDIYTAIIGKNG